MWCQGRCALNDEMLFAGMVDSRNEGAQIYKSKQAILTALNETWSTDACASASRNKSVEHSCSPAVHLPDMTEDTIVFKIILEMQFYRSNNFTDLTKYTNMSFTTVTIDPHTCQSWHYWSHLQINDVHKSTKVFSIGCRSRLVSIQRVL